MSRHHGPHICPLCGAAAWTPAALKTLLAVGTAQRPVRLADVARLTRATTRTLWRVANEHPNVFSLISGKDQGKESSLELTPVGRQVFARLTNDSEARRASTEAHRDTDSGSNHERSS